MHFEDIWNEAEEISKQFPEELVNKERIVAQLQAALNLLERSEQVHTLITQEMIVGNILYSLAGYCALMEKEHNISINSARALKIVTDERKAVLT